MGTRSTALASIAFVLVAGPARADREIEAQQLFEEAKALMSAGRHDQACPKFQASHRLSPSAATLMNLAACHEAQGRLATAWSTFRLAQAQAGRQDPPLVEPSRSRAEALRPRLSSLRIVVPNSSRLPGLEIARAGSSLDEAQWGDWVFVDGGRYEIVVRAPGRLAWSTQVVVKGELDRQEVEVPPLLPLPGNIDSASFTYRRKLALGVTAGGLATLTAGVVLGLRAQSYQNDSNAICPGTSCNDPDGLRLNRDARSTAEQATISFVAGGVLVSAGVALWLLGSPSRSNPGRLTFAPVVSGAGPGVVVAGAL